MLRARLAAGSPLRRAEAEQLVGKRLFAGGSLWAELARVPPSGTWERRRADLYALAEDWIGPCGASRSEGMDLLVRRYLGAFGPAPIDELAGWAGIPVGEVAPALARLTPLRRFRTTDGEELIDLPRAVLPDPDVDAPPRFLPTWDATLLVHARRAAVLPEEYRPLVFNTKTPQSVPTVLVDGAVAGTWRYDGGRVKIESFSPVRPGVRRALEEEAERLAAFHR